MKLKFHQIAKGGIMTFIGYLLSPLSWWNDPFINFPISWFLATLVSKINISLFSGAFIFFYWLTNVSGLLLFHKGIEKTLNQNHPTERHRYRKFIVKDLIIAVLYSILIFILIKLNIIKPF